MTRRRPRRRGSARAVVGGVLLAVATMSMVRATPAAAVARTGPLMAAPVARAEPGWRLVFSSDFAGSRLPSKCWSYGGPYEAGASYWVEDEVTVSGGLLRLGIHDRAYQGKQYTSGGVGCFEQVQLYGKYEWRARVPPGKGIDSYVTLWPADGQGGQATLVEIVAFPGDETMAITNEYGNGGSVGKHVPGRYSDGFHTYTIEWTPTLFRVLVDGVQKFRSTQISKVKKWIGFVVSNGDDYAFVPDDPSVLPAQFQVDWLRVYAYVPNAGPAPAPTVTPSPTAGPTVGPTGPGPDPGPDPDASGASAGQATGVARAENSATTSPWWAYAGIAALAVFVMAGVTRIVWRRRRN